MNKRKNFAIFLILGLAINISACTKTITHGQHIDEYKLSEIKIGSTSKSEVVSFIGSPTYISHDDPNVWYYIERTVSKKFVFSPKLDNQEITKVTFSEDGVVASITKKDSGYYNISPETKSTKAYMQQKGFIKKVLGGASVAPFVN